MMRLQKKGTRLENCESTRESNDPYETTTVGNFTPPSKLPFVWPETSDKLNTSFEPQLAGNSRRQCQIREELISYLPLGLN